MVTRIPGRVDDHIVLRCIQGAERLVGELTVGNGGAVLQHDVAGFENLIVHNGPPCWRADERRAVLLMELSSYRQRLTRSARPAWQWGRPIGDATPHQE